MPRWLSLTIPLYWIASCRRPTGFLSAYQPATPTKPLTSLSYPPLVLQYQNPCKWIPPRFLVRNSRADWRLDLLPITTWGPTLRPPRPAVSTIQSEPVICPLSMLSVQLFTPVRSITASALVVLGNLTSWREFCHQHCLTELPRPLHKSPAVQIASTWIESPEPSITPSVPSDYMAFLVVFRKQAFAQLPPHRPWDCAIDLLPGNKLPKGRVSAVHPGAQGYGGIHPGGS